MAGTSVGKSLNRPCSGRKTLRRCQNNTTTNNVVFIDVDGDDVENVIVIDSPELFSEKLRGSSVNKDKQHQQRVVICIDDEESTDNNHPDTGVKKRCNFSSGASSSKGPSAAAENRDKFQNEVSDGSEFVQENISSPVKISKCKRTYSGKAPSRNRYGLCPESDNDFSNDEFLDCELVEEDSSGSVREQWEKAFSKRKYESRNGQPDVVGCSKTFKPSRNANYREKVVTKQPKEPPVFSSLGKVSCETGPSSTDTGSIPPDITFKSGTPSLEDPVSKSALYEHGPYNEDNFDNGSDHLAENVSMDCGGFNFPNAEPEGPSLSPRDSAEGVDPVTESSQLREKSETMQENSSRLTQEQQEQASCNSKSENSYGRSGNRDYNGYTAAKNNVPGGSAAKQCKRPPTFTILQEANYKRKLSPPSSPIGNLSQEPFSKRGNLGGHILKSVLKGLHPYNKTSTHSTLDPLAEESKTNCHENQYQQYFEHNNHRAEDDRPVPKCVSLQEKSDELLGSAERCMVSDREKLKETDEYKKAMEEEWASRRRALQIQAEEANQLRRLRKRENAERMRLLDMERRQKQRVEEIRETKKKDEEQMNIKDLIRVEVRNELSKVEKACSDMASLLRSLGIQVGGELRPNADEVRAACKRALFSFHPDRAAKSNTRQQVEAEEKFKLIIRMKEKFSVS